VKKETKLLLVGLSAFFLLRLSFHYIPEATIVTNILAIIIAICAIGIAFMPKSFKSDEDSDKKEKND